MRERLSGTRWSFAVQFSFYQKIVIDLEHASTTFPDSRSLDSCRTASEFVTAADGNPARGFVGWCRP
ncbi:MAG: hypothetical protein ACM3X0_02560 [Bacteroidota bacterium]